MAGGVTSEKPKRLNWAMSIGFVALGVPAFHVSLAFFIWGPISEEIAKAFGAWSARLQRNRLSWWVIAATVGASFGLIERILLNMNWTPEFRAQFTPLEALTYDTIAVFSHAALCVLSVAIAFALRGGWAG